MQERTSQSQPSPIYKPPQRDRVVGSVTRLKSGAPDARQGATKHLTPYVWCSGVSHVSTFESHASISNGHLWTTGCDQVSTGCVRYSPVSCTERLSNLRSHRTRSTHGTHAQRGLQTSLTPNAEHGTHSGASGALSENLS